MKALRILFLFVACLGLNSTFAQTDKDVILTVEDEKVIREDFESIFKKNNRDSVITKASLDEYMELFINFKLKVREAVEMGLDTSKSFKRELKGYRKQLSRPYLIDQELLDALMMEAYERKKKEIRASHILINCDPNASPADTMAAYERIVALRNRIVAGENFSDVATSKGGSQDPSVRDNKGDLGYFSAFQMVYPFEEAAFNTPVGEISDPVRTRYGYHILQVTDERPARGEIRTAHIMIRYEANKSTSKADALSKANEIHELLLNGADFAEMAAKYSEDNSTAKRAGELPWFGTGKMVEAFENTAFGLEKDGDISEPFETSYGFHIVKRLEYRPIPTYKELKSEIKSKVSRDARAEMTKKSFLNKLEKEYDLQVDSKCLKPLYKAAKADSAFSGKGLGPIKSKVLGKTLVSFADQTRSVGDFVNHLESTKIKNKQLSPEEIVDMQLESYIEDELMTYEDEHLEEKHREFRLLMDEYHDGILLFELTDQKVWSKAVKDTLGLEGFYEANKQNFMWKDRADAVIFTAKDKTVANKVKKLIAKGKSVDQIKREINKDTKLNLSTESGVFEKGDQEILDQLEWKAGVSKMIEKDGQQIMVLINEVLPATPKALDEARGLVTAEYQNHLEAQWIESLRSKYKYEVNEEVLHSIK